MCQSVLETCWAAGAAVQLVLQASALGRGGEVFVLEMGDLVRIADLAKDLIQLSGLEVGRDIEIVYTGLRPGEKLFEEIRLAGEEYTPTCHDKIFVSRNGLQLAPGLADLSGQVDELLRLAQVGDEAQIRAKLQQLVPEYLPAQGLSA
jgi:FlaA1/EpsC-like NDP-sugar epimerase